MKELIELYFNIEKEYNEMTSEEENALPDAVASIMLVLEKKANNYINSKSPDVQITNSFRQALSEFTDKLKETSSQHKGSTLKGGKKAAHKLFLCVLGDHLKDDLQNIHEIMRSKIDSQKAEEYLKDNKRLFGIYTVDDLDLDYDE